MKSLVLVLAVLMISGADDPKPKPAAPNFSRLRAREDMRKFQGRWECVSWQFSGTTSDNGKGQASVYEDDRITLSRDGKDYRHGIVAIDPMRTPRAINTWDIDGPNADQTTPGIYEINGETLKLCFSTSRKDRPTEFDSQPGDGRLNLVYKKVKPALSK